MSLHELIDGDRETGVVGKGREVSPAILGGHVLTAVAVSRSPASHDALGAEDGVREIAVPAERSARLRFLKKWAREQRRRALSGGAWSLLVLPVFAGSAVAQGEGWEVLSSVEGVAGTEIQPDGSLAVRLENGQTVVIPEGQFTVSAEGQILVQAEALAGLEGVASAGAGAGASGALAALGGAIAVGLGAGGGGGGGGGGAATSSGFVIDGYISGATVFRDENGNGLLDDGEARTTTDEQGAFSGLGGDQNAPIVSVGGTDISTGLAFNGTLKAPAGSTVISPVTTLVQQIVEADETGATTIDQAIARVNAALGLEESTDVLNEDPIESGNNSLFAAGAKVANIVNVGVAAGADEDRIIEALADAIVNAEVGDEPLNDGEEIQEVLETALDGKPSKSDIDAVSDTIANANNAIDDSADEGDADAIADVQQIVQTEIAEEVEDGELNVAKSQDEVEEDAENAQDIEDGKVNFGAGFAEEFSDDITLSDSTVSEHGAWYVDRYAPASFEVVEDFGTVDEDFAGESVLRLTTEFVADQGAFDQTQGRKFDLPDGSTEASIQLYIDPAWEPADDATSGFRQAGFWTTAIDAEGDLHYPIIEFSTLNGEDTFRVYTGVGSGGEAEWINLGLPGGFEYGSFQTLNISVNDDGSVTFQVGNLTQTVGLDNGDFNVVSLDNVILQGHNGYSVDPNNPSSDRPAYDIYWDNLTSNGSFIEEDTDLSDFVLEVNFGASVYEVIEGVEFTLDIDQADGLQVTGAGVVKLVGEFNADVDLSGITTPIDATDLSGVNLTITAEQADGLQIDLAADAALSIDVDYADLSTENPSLNPEIDLSGITVNGSSSPVDLINVLDAGGVENTFKLLWSFADNNYYDALPGGTPDVNAANVELGNLYAQYLLDGGEPLLDIVQTKVGGEPDFDARQQSLHDNLLGNIKDSVVESRVNSNALDEDNRDAAGLQFGDRPIYDGRLSNEDDLLATQVWDVANGIPRSDFAVGNGEIFVLNGNTVVDADADSSNGITPFSDLSDAIDAAADGAHVLVGAGIYSEGEDIIISSSLNIVGVDGAVSEGRFVVDGDNTPNVVVNVTGLDVIVTPDSDSAGPNTVGLSHGFYLTGSDITLNLENVDITKNGDFTSRGVLNEIGTGASINVVGGSFTNLTSGIYMNPGETSLNVDGATFTGNLAGIGTDDPGAVTVINSTFDGNGEAIGFGGSQENNDVTLTGNEYVQETDQVLVYFAREDGAAEPAVSIPGEWSNVTIVQSSDPDNGNSQLATMIGTAGDDIVVDNVLDTSIDLTAGGADFVLLSDSLSEGEGFNEILGFTAGSGAGADQLAFVNLDVPLRGNGVETLSGDDTMAADTGFVIFTTAVGFDLTYEAILNDQIGEEDIGSILDAALSLAGGGEGAFAMAVTDGEDTVILGINPDENVEAADQIIDVAFLDGVVATDLTADNLYDFSAVNANT